VLYIFNKYNKKIEKNIKIIQFFSNNFILPIIYQSSPKSSYRSRLSSTLNATSPHPHQYRRDAASSTSPNCRPPSPTSIRRPS